MCDYTSVSLPLKDCIPLFLPRQLLSSTIIGFSIHIWVAHPTDNNQSDHQTPDTRTPLVDLSLLVHHFQTCFLIKTGQVSDRKVQANIVDHVENSHERGRWLYPLQAQSLLRVSLMWCSVAGYAVRASLVIVILTSTPNQGCFQPIVPLLASGMLLIGVLCCPQQAPEVPKYT